jgi:hypothetical protein
MIARGNVQHDYYQVLILPSICILGGIGGEFLLNSGKNLSNRFVAPIILVVVIGFSFVFSWYHIRDFFNINNNSIIVAGQAVDRLTPKDSKVIANYNGDTTFLYQTKRKGWARKLIIQLIQNFKSTTINYIRADVINENMIPLLTSIGFKQQKNENGYETNEWIYEL